MPEKHRNAMRHLPVKTYLKSTNIISSKIAELAYSRLSELRCVLQREPIRGEKSKIIIMIIIIMKKGAISTLVFRALP